MEKIQTLKNKYPKFVYQNYSYEIFNNNLKISFNFKIEPNIFFKPELTIENIPKDTRKIPLNLIFQLGLIEMISYWKATCSPVIEIQAGHLNKEQIKWWQDLIINGLGQFFYENKIKFQKPKFIIPPKSKTIQKTILVKGKKVLVPIGGGKDSVVTLELLKKVKKDINCFSLNPTKAAKKIMKIAGCKKPIIVRRKIDKKLLELNKKGFLNGHTPFSAYLAFLSILVATIFEYKYIAFSNERSADEGNVKYLGRMINHQYSKTSEFERKFKNYCIKHLAKNINYFSFLRKYTEFEISKMFLKYPKYFLVFSSCNIASKAGDRWCGNCPKCLFVYATFYPFLEKKQLLKIFGKDLFENKKLLETMKALIGEGKFKPFECVGTYKESRVAFNLSFKKAKKAGKLPYLLSHL